MLEVKWKNYDEQDSHFYCPPKPKDYYVSKGVYDTKPTKTDTKNTSYSSDLSDFLGGMFPPKPKKK